MTGAVHTTRCTGQAAATAALLALAGALLTGCSTAVESTDSATTSSAEEATPSTASAPPAETQNEDRVQIVSVEGAHPEPEYQESRPEVRQVWVRNYSTQSLTQVTVNLDRARKWKESEASPIRLVGSIGDLAPCQQAMLLTPAGYSGDLFVAFTDDHDHEWVRREGSASAKAPPDWEPEVRLMGSPVFFAQAPRCQSEPSGGPSIMPDLPGPPTNPDEVPGPFTLGTGSPTGTVAP